MKHQIVWALVVANVALAGTLAWRGIGENTAVAQAVPPAGNEPGKYVMIPSDSQIGVSIVYIFDTVNKRLGGVAPDKDDKIQQMPTISVASVFEGGGAGAGVRPAGENNGNNGNNRNRPRQ